MEDVFYFLDLWTAVKIFPRAYDSFVKSKKIKKLKNTIAIKYYKNNTQIKLIKNQIKKPEKTPTKILNPKSNTIMNQNWEDSYESLTS